MGELCKDGTLGEGCRRGRDREVPKCAGEMPFHFFNSPGLAGVSERGTSLTGSCAHVQADNVKRTFDYEPFVKEFITCLQNEGLLDDALAQNSPLKGDTELGGNATTTSKTKSKKKS